MDIRVNVNEMEPNEFSDRKQEPAQTTGLTRQDTGEHGKTEKRQLNWRLLAALIGVVVAFALGFVPMWLKAARHANERDAAERQVTILELRAMIGAAAIDARRGEYEAARQTASDFFTSLVEEVNNPGRSSLTPEQQANLQLLLKERDDLITLLARSDPAAAERLANVYLNFRRSLATQAAATPTPKTASTPN